MKIKKILRIVLLLFSLLASTNSHAVLSLEPSQWVNIAQNVITQVKSAYTAVKTEYIALKAAITANSTFIAAAETAKTAIETAKTAAETYNTVKRLERHYDVITGNYSFGALLNAANDRSLRRYMPTDYNTTVNAINRSSIPSSMAALDGAVQAYKTKNAYYTTANLFIDPTTYAATQYNEQFTNNLAISSLAYASLNQTDQRFRDIELLIDKIDTADAPKAAWDLGNRISAQKALLSNEQIRLQALLIRQKAVEDERLLKQRADTIRVATAPITYDW